MTENEISNKIIGCALEVDQALGPSLLESAYQECLFYKLQKEKLRVEKSRGSERCSFSTNSNLLETWRL
jgi:GxxExxY protein